MGGAGPAMFQQLFNVIAPVLVCAGIGWARAGRPFDTQFVSSLVTAIGAPCLVFATMLEVEVDPAALTRMAVATVLAHVAFGAIGWTVLRASRLSQRSYLPSLMFSNTGNMGLPLCMLAFGEFGLALAIAYFTVASVIHFTLGIGIAAGAMSWRGLVRLPILYAVAAVLVFMAAGTRPPEWVMSTARLLGGMTVPLMLVTLGISLASLRVTRLGRGLALAALRVGMGFVVGVAIATALGLEGAAKGALVVQSAMPVAVFNFLFAQRYRTEPEDVAGMVVLSTLISFAILPLLLWYLL